MKLLKYKPILLRKVQLFFFLNLFLGIYITLTADSWFILWIGIEINFISFLPIILTKRIYTHTNTIKYFTIQALASQIFLFTITASASFDTLDIISSLRTITLILKLGSFPFQGWFIIIVQQFSWLTNIIFFTIQKIIPLNILTLQTPSSRNWILISALFGVLIRAIGGINQTNLRKLIAYSSLGHLSWIMARITIDIILWIKYFIIYSFMRILIIYFFQLINLNSFQDLISLKNPGIASIVGISFLSLGGFPPFLGFFSKILIIDRILKINIIFIPFFLTIRRVIRLYYYLIIGWISFIKIEKNFLNFSSHWTIILRNFGFLLPLFLFSF